MADMKEVNKAIRAAFPTLDVEAVRGEGYVWFTGRDGLNQVDSIYSNPISTPTEKMVRMCFENVREVL